MNYPDTVPDMGLHRARISGGSEAVYDYDNQRRYTYSELEERASNMAAFLTEELGLKKGDRVAFCTENSIAHIDAFFMSYKTGIVITTYNCLMGARQLERLLAQESPRVVFYSALHGGCVEPWRAVRPETAFIAVRGEPDARDRCRYEEVVGYRARGTAVPRRPVMEDIQMLIHTGGTTGEPKAAMMSYRAILCNALSEMFTVELHASDSAYVFLPFFHTAGWNVLMVPILLVGGRVILTAGFDAGTALKIIHEERPTVSIGVETVYKLMLRHPDFAQTDFSGYRWMLCGAAPVSRQTMEAYWRKGVRMINAYGMTEVGPSNLVPPVNTMTAEELDAKWNAAGKPMVFNELRVVDDDGRDVADGERGELWFRGCLCFSGYWMEPRRTREMLRDGWVRTGDIAYRDDDGYYYICGRKKNMYISGGENIYPTEIEHILCGHPAVESACVIGVPDEKWGEAGKALVVLKPGRQAGRDELRARVEAEGSSIKVPKYIQFVSEIPRNHVGKLDLCAVRERYGYCGEE